MRPLRAIEEVFLLALCGFGVGAVGVGVGYFGCLAELASIEGVPCGDESGEGRNAEDVAERQMLAS